MSETSTPARNDAPFWELLEAAWAPLGAETAALRTALTRRDPAEGDDERAVEWAFTLEKALDRVLDHLDAATRDLTSAELTDLDRAVEGLLHDLDRSDVHAVLDGSDDGFLYTRGFVVALGREYYDAVRRDPRMGVADAECESLCYLFARHHHERHGDFPDTGSGISRESFADPVGWPS